MQPRAGGTLNLAVFYHIWAAGAWEEPLAEFLDTLDRSGYDGPLYLGVVGTSEERRAAKAAVTRDCKVAIVAEVGYEQVTLGAIRNYAQDHDGAVLYGHTKGASRDYTLQRPWRREVTEQLLLSWRENLAALTTHDVLGSSWQDWGSEPSGFLANFWMARCDYLRMLPEPIGRRTAAETWLGLGQPRIHDLAPQRMRWIPTDGRDVDGGREIQVPSDSIAIMISEDGGSVLAVQIVPKAWLPEVTERMVWRILQPEESQAWRQSYA